MLFSKIKEAALDILFPPLCLSCRNGSPADKPLCADCLLRIPLNNSVFCPICGLRLAEGKNICNHPKAKRKTYPFILAAATLYAEPLVEESIRLFKYRSLRPLAGPLSEILISYARIVGLPKICGPNPLVIAMPLHSKKLKSRGYNQAALLAGNFAAAFGFETSSGDLIRIKNTAPHAKASYQKRQQDILGAFAVADSANIRNRDIILVDDVYTSGATAKEAAKTLKASGAGKIIVLVLARA